LKHVVTLGGRQGIPAVHRGGGENIATAQVSLSKKGRNVQGNQGEKCVFERV